MNRSSQVLPPFILDWESMNVNVEGSRYSHLIKRPTADHQLAWFTDSNSTTGIDDADARLYDAIVIDTTGYNDAVPSSHKSAVVFGLYDRRVILHEIFKTGAISVLESLTGFEMILHKLRLPTKHELMSFPSTPSVERSIEFYDLLLERVDGIRLRNGDVPSRKDCMKLIALSVKLTILGAFLEGMAQYLEPFAQVPNVRRNKKRRK